MKPKYELIRKEIVRYKVDQNNFFVKDLDYYKIPEYLLKSWKKQTAYNHHTEVRRAIADYFGLGILSIIFLAIQKRQDEVNFLEPHMQMIRYYAETLMCQRIEQEYGEDILRQVTSCL